MVLRIEEHPIVSSSKTKRMDKKMSVDTSDTLKEIQKYLHGQSLSSALIQIQENGGLHKRSKTYIRRLECLSSSPEELDREGCQRSCNGISPSAKFLRRRSINLLHPHEDYVVVSWPWGITKEVEKNAYYVESKQTGELKPSAVKQEALDRVIMYAKYCNCKLFWIDKECLDQENKKLLQTAMQSMDQVYRRSKFPVGLMSVRIESREQLYLLIKLLRGRFVCKRWPYGSTFQLTVGLSKALKVLKLIELLMSDEWWIRAWIFQENYVSGKRMMILIPHCSSLEAQKQKARRYLGKLQGELCVNSADFRENVTKFCQAFQKQHIHLRNKEICDILQWAGKYTILLRRPPTSRGRICKPMSPTLYADAGIRDITDHSDILAIIANCCGYSMRLDTGCLESERYSLSLCLLALYILNGEILRNDEASDCLALSGTIFDYLKKHSIKSFRPPVVRNELTFLKNCRFVTVKLSKEGIETTGHLWKLGKVIEIKQFSEKLPYEEYYGGLRKKERQYLRQFADELGSGRHGKRYKIIAKDIKEYLSHDARRMRKRFSNYKGSMARELAYAIENRNEVRLACLVPRIEQQGRYIHSPYRGVFINRPTSKWTRDSYIFTASSSADGNPKKHLSMKVDWRGLTDQGLPRLITKEWINGLYFSAGCSRRDVVFPWPDSLVASPVIGYD